jgi:FHA domain
MSNFQRYSSWLVVIIAFFVSTSLAQPIKTSVDSIAANPGRYIDNAIQVEGLVVQYVPATATTTSHYLLRGDYGAVLRVNTAEGSPETNRKYQVTGIVYIDPVGKEVFISEKTRTPFEAPPSSQEGTEHRTDNTPIYITIGLLVILVAVLVYLQLRKKNLVAVGDSGRPVSGASESEPTYSTSSEFKTVKIVTSAPKTLKFIPGQLVITSSDDKGKSFRVAGYPTSEGSIVTIGRDSLTGDRSYAHIQIDKKFSTVSRKHAELVYKDGKLYVKNLSDTNPTQVDGYEIKMGEMVELKPNSTLRTGELEFQYKV